MTPALTLEWLFDVVVTEGSVLCGFRMDNLHLVRLARAAMILLLLGIVLFVGGAAAIATRAVALGAVLIALAILCPGIGCVLMFVLWKRARRYTRDMQARQQVMNSQLEQAIRDYQHRHRTDTEGDSRLP